MRIKPQVQILNEKGVWGEGGGGGGVLSSMYMCYDLSVNERNKQIRIHVHTYLPLPASRIINIIWENTVSFLCYLKNISNAPCLWKGEMGVSVVFNENLNYYT